MCARWLRLAARHWYHTQLAIVAFALLLIEFYGYRHGAYTWPESINGISRQRPLIADGTVASTTWRWLLVADPQLIGYQNERFGWIARWDSDRYLRRTFQYIYSTTQPDIVVFLGDLLDEGSIATETEFEATVARFKSIFDLGEAQTIFIAGDNDIGGEGEPITEANINRFARSFHSHYNLGSAFLSKHLNVSLYEIRLFGTDITHLSSSTMQRSQERSSSVDLGETTSFRVVLTHTPIYYGAPLALSEKMLEKIGGAQLILSAHRHLAEAAIVTHDGRRQYRSIYRRGGTFTVQLDASRTVELQVPTCSYRMGAPDMGYGLLDIEPPIDDEWPLVHYDVIWLPERFPQLTAYAIFLCILLVLNLCRWLCTRVDAYHTSTELPIWSTKVKKQLIKKV